MDNTQIDSDDTPRGSTDTDTELRSIGDYRILRRLGEGGMGAVYLGYNEKESLQVAVKVLNDQLASNQDFIDRFYREAKSGAILNHPNIVRSITAGQDAVTGKHYLVLEYVDGISVQALLDHEGQLPIGDAVHIVLDVARGLEHAHSRNLVHRDIKPDNILLTRSGVAKLVDFGLAKRVDEASHLTGARQTFGTTPYMPYEQARRAKNADGRSDIYALGATLYHLVTGAVPFPGANHIEVIEKKGRGKYAPAVSLNPAVPPSLEQILSRMLARDPSERYQTVSELIVELERSRLCAAVPSFADPEQMRKDTWVQARLSDNAIPTRLDPESPLSQDGDGLDTKDTWVLRYRNRAGQLRHLRGTTAEIVARLGKGKLPPALEVRRIATKEFHSPVHYPEFQAVAHLVRSHKKTRRAAGNSVEEKTLAVAPRAAKGRQALQLRRRGWMIWLVGLGATIALVAGLLALLYSMK
jgi:serine/threonine protein kinase